MSADDTLARAVDQATGELARTSARLADAPRRQLPRPEDAACLFDAARGVLFPEVWLAKDTVPREYLAALAERVRDLVAMEHHAGCPDPSPSAADCASCSTLGGAAAVRLVRAVPEIRGLLEGDIVAALDADPAADSAVEVALCYPGLQALAAHRVGHVLWEAGGRLLARLLSEHAHARTGIDIHPGASIGARFFIDHGTGVVIGETSTIGANVRLYQGVTIGARSLPRAEAHRIHGHKRHPTLEDDVIVYANATILGGDTVIGKGAIVGGNTWVTTSVGAGARVSLDVMPRAAEAVVSYRPEHRPATKP
jgi:serine O-acetyltransferase